MSTISSRTTASNWRARTASVGWVLLPLRMFLGITMVYAGLLKLFDGGYLDAASPDGVQQQMQMAAVTSPIGPLVSFTAAHAVLFGLAIAFGELAVGLGVLLGLWTRVAAIGGFLLSLSFFLTVSWGTSPYFFGSDIVFMFAFIPLIIGGDGGVLSIEARVRRITAGQSAGAAPSSAAARSGADNDVERRALLRTGGIAAAIGLGALAVGALGRAVSGGQASAATSTSSAGGAPDATAVASTTATATDATGTTGASGTGKPKGGKRIGKAADVAVGGVLAFTNPKTSTPAYVLQPKNGTYLAYSAVCTHQGCTVGYDQGSDQFACPCHGARFDAHTGDVVRGPARKPLAKVDVVEANGSLYVV